MAYGARLESGLGASPRGFESPYLRQLKRSDQEEYSGQVKKYPGVVRTWSDEISLLTISGARITRGRVIGGSQNATTLSKDHGRGLFSFPATAGGSLADRFLKLQPWTKKNTSPLRSRYIWRRVACL